MFEQRFLFFCGGQYMSAKPTKMYRTKASRRYSRKPTWLEPLAHRPHLRGKTAAVHKTSCANKYIECWFINVVLI